MLWSQSLPAHFFIGMRCQRFSYGHRLHLAGVPAGSRNLQAACLGFFCVCVGGWGGGGDVNV